MGFTTVTDPGTGKVIEVDLRRWPRQPKKVPSTASPHGSYGQVFVSQLARYLASLAAINTGGPYDPVSADCRSAAGRDLGV